MNKETESANANFVCVVVLAEFSTRVEKQIQDMQTKSENTKMEVGVPCPSPPLQTSVSRRVSCGQAEEVNKFENELKKQIRAGVSTTNADATNTGVGEWFCLDQR